MVELRDFPGSLEVARAGKRGPKEAQGSEQL